MSAEMGDKQVMMIDLGGLAAIALLAAGAYGLFLGPRWQAAAALEERRGLLAQRVKESQDAAGNLRMQKGNLERCKSEAEHAPVKLMRTDELNGRLSELTGLTEGLSAGSIKVDQISPGQAIRSGQFAVVPIRLAGEGSYRSFVELLSALGDRFRDTAVTEFTLLQDGAKANKARFQVDLAWYTEPVGGGGRGAGAGGPAASAEQKP